MEMVLQQSATASILVGNSAGRGGCRPCPRPASMAVAAKREPEPDDQKEDGEAEAELRRGPWTVDEDLTLINYIAEHGEGRWNALARAAGLKRTGKSCRLRWLNYLRPDVKRGDFTADEQLLILDLHSRWGNRWSKIAAQLPGRTDNEIKNYWRTRVQKHAKQLNCDVNSKRFKDAMRFLWMPRLAERAAVAHHHHQSSSSSPASSLPAAGDLTGCVEKMMMMTAMNDVSSNSDDRSPSSGLTTTTSSSSGGSFTSESNAVVPVAGEEWAAMQRQQQEEENEFWSTATALQQLTGGEDQLCVFQQDMQQDLISGWVQGFSDGVSPEVAQLWSLDDIWRMQ
ncbi:hypothetical protein HU200_053939 [Digitaria exilis]|uniref:Uncharacterized protein n=1 Tax=Digitaria exilis TaxID=1010633 RepID=A0A835E2U4_9POAL|nr:hypothetical protein HU200_053939 [Digitaria exilis]CAB3492253.1 unnamed protein product [Digitaria exilis]